MALFSNCVTASRLLFGRAISSSFLPSTSFVRRGLSENAESESDTTLPEFEGKGIEKSVNSVTLLGRVGITPQVRGTEQHPVVAFSLATNIRYKPAESGDYLTKTDWHNVAVFKGSLRETVAKNVHKGMRVLVQGRIMYGTIEDKMGTVRHTTTIVADDVIRFG